MTDAPTNAQLVARVGEALYGERWVADLARRLKVEVRTVERVAKAAREGDDYRAAAAWLDDLQGFLAHQAAVNADLTKQLREARGRNTPRPDFAALGRQINGGAGPIIRTPRLDD